MTPTKRKQREYLARALKHLEAMCPEWIIYAEPREGWIRPLEFLELFERMNPDWVVYAEPRESAIKADQEQNDQILGM